MIFLNYNFQVKHKLKTKANNGLFIHMLLLFFICVLLFDFCNLLNFDLEIQVVIICLNKPIFKT